jgi:ribose-phosphate pyrophosphokinase
MPTESATPTAEATRLPGLEVVEAKPEVRPEHWIERGPSKRLMLFAGRSHPELAQKIAEKLGIQLGEVSLRTFADGNTYCRYEESIRGADLFIVQTSSPPVDQHLMELLIMIDAAKLASAKRITAVLPLYPYSRQDKKSRPRESITAKLVAEMIQSAGADRVLTMDLHAGQIQGFFEVPVDHMTALPMLARYFRDLGMPEELVAVAPDTGRTRLAGKFAEMIGGDLAVLQKDRPAHNVAHITNIIGDVDGKCAIMTDDMVDTAGTLVAGAEFLKNAGATKVYACATHGIFSPPAIARIEESPLDSVVVTDTVPINPLTKPDRVTALTVADILAETIHNVFADDSVSAIFGDMNALF